MSEAAFPYAVGPAERFNPQWETGLTKRELFAAMALQGMLAYAGKFAEGRERDGALIALRHADALIEELNK